MPLQSYNIKLVVYQLSICRLIKLSFSISSIFSDNADDPSPFGRGSVAVMSPGSYLEYSLRYMFWNHYTFLVLFSFFFVFTDLIGYIVVVCLWLGSDRGRGRCRGSGLVFLWQWHDEIDLYTLYVQFVLMIIQLLPGLAWSLVSLENFVMEYKYRSTTFLSSIKTKLVIYWVCWTFNVCSK